MIAYLIDYEGTLDLLKDPISAVRTLKARGHVVVLWSASCGSTIDRDHPGLRREFHHIAPKDSGLDFLLWLKEEEHRDLDQVVYVDDDPWWKDHAENSERLQMLGLHWGYEDPREFWKLLGAT